MNVWPTSLVYTQSLSYSCSPSSIVNTSISKSRRQRLALKNRDDKFNVVLSLNDAELLIFEEFARNNPDNFLGPYFDSDLEQQGTLRIVEGKYSSSLASNLHWEVSFQIEVIDRNHDAGKDLYSLAVDMSADFSSLAEMSDALAIAVNENNL